MNAKKSSVKLYSTPMCIWCGKTKEFFKTHKVKFKNIDVSKDRKAAHELIHKTHQIGVPVVEIDGHILIGYNEEELKRLLKIK